MLSLMPVVLMLGASAPGAATSSPAELRGDGISFGAEPSVAESPVSSALVATPERIFIAYEDGVPSHTELDDLRASDEPGADVKPAPDDSAELAKKLSNPIADLISVPIQTNLDFGIGPKDAEKLTINVQPVIPFSISREWNLITRTILPVIYAESPADGIDSEFGLGDTTQSFFFSPKKVVDGWTWGVGPVFLWPTATTTSLGTQKWGIGPTAVLLRQKDGWTYGALLNHVWSYAGDSDREDVNSTFIQPFLAYTWPTATTLTLNTESSYNWEASQWTVPLNLQLSQVLRIGKLPISLQIGGRYYAEVPEDGPEWGLRFTLTFLFPR